jgi:transposase
LPEDEKQCACGSTLVRIGEETSERLAIIPRRVYVERHIRPKYACHACEGSGDESRAAVRTAPVPPSIIPRSITSPALLATILINKFCDHLPFYRQEDIFARDGLDLSRQDMANWAIKVGEAVEPLVTRLEKRLLEFPLIQMDETPLQVLGEPERSNTSRSYMWLARGGPPGKQVILYRYQPSRSAKHPSSFLKDYHGYLQTDGYEAYETALSGTDIVHVGCWAHARRKFDEAAKAGKTPGLAVEGLERIKQLYILERNLRGQVADGSLNSATFLEMRKTKAEMLMKDLETWLSDQSGDVLPTSLVGKAVAYTLGQWKKLVRYVDLIELTPDNNACENAIRPFVLGRKNWLFSGSPQGARTSCNIYTLIETAKANGLKPWDYIERLCEILPGTPEHDLDLLLPFA